MGLKFRFSVDNKSIKDSDYSLSLVLYLSNSHHAVLKKFVKFTMLKMKIEPRKDPIWVYPPTLTNDLPPCSRKMLINEILIKA